MKELSVEDKAKRYDEAIKFAKIYHNQGDEDMKTMCETMFPELKENEGEKIRKELIRAFKSLNTIKVWKGIKRTDIIAWLEKHSEQNYAWSEKDEKMLDDAIGAIGAADYYTYDDKQEIENWLKSLKDRVQPQLKQEWSEEDEKEVAILEAYIRSKDWSERHIDRALGIVDELVNKIKSSNLI